jgi:DNA-binding transcriptional MerR regulator
MSTTDATFLWETEALRESTRRRHPEPPITDTASAAPPPPRREPTAAPTGWVTLRQAHEATGIPVETLRKWARRGSIPSHLDEDVKGTRRMIHMDDVETRARDLGREIAPVAAAALEVETTPESTPTEDAAADPRSEVVDVGVSAGNAEDAPPVTVTLDRGPAEAGTMIVPIAAWDKMLMQLGNLHEAGQQLADARERAAKAETENRFLRERLADIRTQKDSAEPPPMAEPVAVEPPHAGPAELPTDAAGPLVEAGAPYRSLSPSRRLVRSLRRWRIEVRRR